MKDVLSYLWLKGGVDSERPWGAEEKVRFVCPVPGYDRHFTLLEWFGIEMVPVPMTDDGPDVDAVAALVADDPSIKGMWLVPTYANPTGQVTTQEVAERLASMPTAAPDFKIFWDNAYALHHLTARRDQDRRHRVARGGRRPPAPSGACSRRRRRSRTPAPASRSSAARARPSPGSTPTSASARSAPTRSTTCGTWSSSAPRRACATTWPSTATCWRRSSPRSSGSSTSGSAGSASRRGRQPRGGYFVSLDVLPGTATRVIELAKAAGVALTPAGSAYPYRRDPDDTNIRLAPSFPTLRRGDRVDGGRRHLRAAGGRGEAARVSP